MSGKNEKHEGKELSENELEEASGGLKARLVDANDESPTSRSWGKGG